MRRLTVLSVTVAAVCLSMGGCGGNTASRSTPARVHVTERDFHIAASVKYVPSGPVLLTVHNQGPDDHELIVVRESGRGARLPLRRDGVTIDEERLTPATVGPGLVPGPPDSRRHLQLALTPGRYVMFCNMAGHYFGGMHAELVVR